MRLHHERRIPMSNVLIVSRDRLFADLLQLTCYSPELTMVTRTSVAEAKSEFPLQEFDSVLVDADRHTAREVLRDPWLAETQVLLLVQEPADIPTDIPSH